MAYCDITNVQARNAARSYTATSKPNASQVVMFIDEAAGIMDQVMGRNGYSTPIPTTAASSVLSLLQGINAVGAVAMIEESAQVSDRKDQFNRMWTNALKMLENDELVGVPKDETQVGPRWAPHDNPTGMFQVDMDL